MLMTIMGCATLQEREERKERMRMAVAETVETKQMHIDITSMNTMRYGSRTVTPDFFLELKGDTVISHLPYFGQLYQAPMMSPSQGLNFETIAKSIRVEKTNIDCLKKGLQSYEKTRAKQNKFICFFAECSNFDKAKVLA